MSTGLVNIIADFSTSLTASVAIGATTATLTSATDDSGVALPTGTYGFTIDRKNSSKEYIECTLTGTALTAVKTIAIGTGIATSGFAKAHRKGAEVIISDFVAIKRHHDILETGYAGATTPTTDYQLATKKYVDDASFAGATNASDTTPGVVELPTQAEVDSGDDSGALGPTVVVPSMLRAKKYHDYAVDSVGSDAYAITITPAITAYVAGQVFNFKAGTANTGAATLNVSGLGAKTIKKNVSEDLQTGDILANQNVMVEYDGTYMQLMSRGQTLAPTIQTFGALATTRGDTTSQYDITNPAGSTFRYTYDVNGTDPGITAITLPVGQPILIEASSVAGGTMSTVNTGYFVVTGSGANYFEVTNASGLAETNKVLNGGYLKTITAQTYTPAANIKYVVVEAQASGAAGKGLVNNSAVFARAGGAGGYSKKIISAATIGASQTLYVGPGGISSASGVDAKYSGGPALFGSILTTLGGSKNLGGSASGGDVNIPGGSVYSEDISSSSIQVPIGGGDSFLGFGGRGTTVDSNGAAGVAGTGYGSGGSGAYGDASSNGMVGGSGADGIIIVTEFY